MSYEVQKNKLLSKLHWPMTKIQAATDFKVILGKCGCKFLLMEMQGPYDSMVTKMNKILDVRG